MGSAEHHGAGRGPVYWVEIGSRQPQGRGKLDVHNRYAPPIKAIFRKPLHRNRKQILNQEPIR